MFRQFYCLSERSSKLSIRAAWPSMKNPVDADRIRAAFKATQGIAEHSFEQHVIDASQVDVNAMIERIASGESSFEEEDEVLMMKWRAMKALQDKGS